MVEELDFDRYELIDEDPMPIDQDKQAPSTQASLPVRLVSKVIERPVEQLLGAPGSIQQARASQAMKPQEIEELNIPEPYKKRALEAAQYYEQSAQNIPTVENIRETFSQFLPEGALESDNAFEKFADRIFSNVPFLAASIGTGGTSALFGIGREAASALGGQIMEELGYGPLAQGLMELGVRGVIDIAKDFRGAKVKPRIEKLRKENYSYTDKVAKGNIVDAPQYLEEMDALVSKATGPNSGMEFRDSRRVARELTAARNDIGRFGTVDLSNAIDKKRHFNSLYNKTGNSYYKAASKFINENVITPFAEKNPEWAKKWYQAEGLTKLFNNVEGAEKAAAQVAKMMLPGGKLKKMLSIGKWFFNSTSDPSIRELYKSARPEVLGALGEVANASLTGDTSSIERALANAHNVIEGTGSVGIESFDTNRYEIVD